MVRKFHPVANIFPLMTGKPFDRLVESIRAHGLLNPIWIHPDDGSIVDGRNRERGCAEAGVEARYREWDGKGSLIAFVVAQNIERRHLTGTQRALLGKLLIPLLAAEAKIRQREAGKHGKEGGRGKKKTLSQTVDQGFSQANANRAMEQAAKLTGTNRQYIADLKKIEKEAPELYTKIEAGEIDLRPAKRALRRIEAERKLATAKSAVRLEAVDLRVCSMQQLLGELRNLDAIVTDPPYPEEYIPLYGELARLAKLALKPNGMLVVMTGQQHLPQILTAMLKHMPWRWEMSYVTRPGPSTRIHSRRVNVAWKPILIFGESKGDAEWICTDVVQSDANDKRYDPWQQSESGIGRLIEYVTKPGQRVCDPFAGTGTTAIACLERGRRFVGCDVSAAAVEKAKARVTLAQAEADAKFRTFAAASAGKGLPIGTPLADWINKIHQGDSVEIMKQMPPKCIDLVVTSPPYNLRNSTGGGMRNRSSRLWGNASLLNGYDGGFTDDMPYPEYVAWQRDCLTEMMRLLNDDGAIFYNQKWRVQDGLLQDRREIVEGFPVRQIIILQRPGGINFNPTYFLPTYEVIYLICKKNFRLAESDDPSHPTCGVGDVWRMNPDRDNDHPAPFPVDLPLRCIKTTGAKTVLDPFMGSGTTAIAAEMLGKHWIGIESSKKYCGAACERLRMSRAAVQDAAKTPAGVADNTS